MTPAETLSARLSDDLKIAMKARDRDAMRVLRSLHAAIANAEAPAAGDGPSWPPRDFDGSNEGTRLVLTALEIEELIRREIADHNDTIATYRANHRDDEADVLAAEVEVLDRYL